MKFEINNYGFVWGEVLVERTCSQEKGKNQPFFQVLTIYSPSGEIIELTMTKRKNRIKKYPKAKE